MKRIGLIVLGLLAALAAALVAAPSVLFEGADHSRFDAPRPAAFDAPESAEHQRISNDIQYAAQLASRDAQRGDLHLLREQLDARGAAMPIDALITPVRADGVSGEWVISPGADHSRRMLYIHGGGYVMGSPTSHRWLASRLSEVANAAVLSVEYRLMPEHPRLAALEDCQRAYRWLLENGPDARSAPATLFVAGDSAGGNIALVTIALARDARLRAADAVVVFSPQTDATLASPSQRRNLKTDVMQRDGLEQAINAPRPIFLWMSFFMNRISPSDPRVSPLFGDLSGLPPIIIQASEQEMFLDDAVRYANKANTQGSQVTLQTWSRTMHAWQAFDTPESAAALAAVSEFLGAIAPARSDS